MYDNDFTVYQRDCTRHTYFLNLQSRIQNNEETEVGFVCLRMVDYHMEMLVPLLKQNTSIKKLDISGNLLTDASVNYLLEVLEENSTITHIDVSGNKISRQGENLLSTVLKSRNITDPINPISSRRVTQ